jgi:hypothetical protein
LIFIINCQMKFPLRKVSHIHFATQNDKKLLFDHKVGEAYFPRDRVPTQPLRASCDRRKEIGPARISVSDRTVSDKAVLNGHGSIQAYDDKT